MKTLHIYGQRSPGEGVHIIGDRPALVELADAIANVLDGEPIAWVEANTRDGSTCQVLVELRSSPAALDRLPLPWERRPRDA